MSLHNIFSQIMNMSLTASVIILFVLLFRQCIKKIPKVFSYALWAVVLFRLICPVSFSSDLSLLGMFDTPTAESTRMTTSVEYVPKNVVYAEELKHIPLLLIRQTLQYRNRPSMSIRSPSTQ